MGIWTVAAFFLGGPAQVNRGTVFWLRRADKKQPKDRGAFIGNPGIKKRPGVSAGPFSNPTRRSVGRQLSGRILN
jgi:hypothetical protein